MLLKRGLFFTAVLMAAGAAAAQGTSQGTAPTADAASGAAVQPGNTNPERDARGIPVISAPANAPAGWNQPARVGYDLQPVPVAPATMAPATNLPPCTRTVTDRCVQTYERGRTR